MSTPSKRITPESGRRAPAIRLKREVLPAPFGPMTPSAAPSGNWRSISSATLTDPKALLRLSSCRITNQISAHGEGRAIAPLCQPSLGDRLHLAARRNGRKGLVVDDD